MPVPNRRQPEKNIWVAAGDGDLTRVQELIEHHSLSPNVPDPNTYTPMHAAASYGHLHILEYLISKGGDVNITDEDGDTPLYVVENVETAQWLVNHGSIVNRQNSEGVSPAQCLSEDFPEVAAYLGSLNAPVSQQIAQVPTQNLPSQHAQNIASETLTTSLLESVHDIMQRADAEGRDPDDELRQVVGRTVLEGVAAGYDMSAEASDIRHSNIESPGGTKRSRTDGDS